MVGLKDNQQQKMESKQFHSCVMLMECTFLSLKVYNLKVYVQWICCICNFSTYNYDQLRQNGKKSHLCISQSHTRSKLTVGKYREVQTVNSDQPFCLECLCKVWTVFPECCSSSRVRLSITQISFKKLGYEWYSSQVQRIRGNFPLPPSLC